MDYQNDITLLLLLLLLIIGVEEYYKFDFEQKIVRGKKERLDREKPLNFTPFYSSLLFKIFPLCSRSVILIHYSEPA
uniref:Uncharacterized protein n=1 Tax=Salix viminalis TaxID=40686 RepID=A0A6N2NM59_SALVM